MASRSLVYLAGSLATRAIGAVTAIVLTRFLDPNEYGVLAVVSSVTGVLAPLLLLGADSGPTVYRYTLSGSAYRAFLSALQRAAVLIPGAILLVFDLLGRRFGPLVWPAFQWAPAMSLGFGIAFLSVIQGVALAVRQADQDARGSSILGIGQSSILAISTFACVALVSQTATGVLLAQLLACLIGAVVSHILIGRRTLWVAPDWAALGRAIRIYAPVLPHGVCIWLLNLSDRWILGRFVSLDAVGIYSVGYSIGMLVLAVGGSQVRAFGPAYVEERSKPNVDVAALDRLAAVYAAGPIFLALALSVLASELLALLSSPRYAEAAIYVPWISFAYAVFVAIYQTNVVAIEFRQRMSSLLLISVPAAILNVTLNLWLVPMLGALAAALTTLIALVYMAAASSVVRWRVDGRRPPFRHVGMLFGVSVSTWTISSYTAHLGWSTLLLKLLLLSSAAVAFLKITGLLGMVGQGLRSILRRE